MMNPLKRRQSSMQSPLTILETRYRIIWLGKESGVLLEVAIVDSAGKSSSSTTPWLAFFLSADFQVDEDNGAFLFPQLVIP